MFRLPVRLRGGSAQDQLPLRSSRVQEVDQLRQNMKTTNLNTFLAIVCRCYDLCTEPQGLTLKSCYEWAERPEPFGGRGMSIHVFTERNGIRWRGREHGSRMWLVPYVGGSVVWDASVSVYVSVCLVYMGCRIHQRMRKHCAGCGLIAY